MHLATYTLLKSGHLKGEVPLEGDLLKEYQESIRKMADDVAAVCEANGIKYSLGGGSALGAVRHKGMIPWDDDMDLNFLREDLDRFLLKFEKEYGDQYWIHTPEKTSNYGLLFVQLRKKGTIARSREDKGNECGVPLDLFPLENTYDNVILRKLHGIICLTTKFALSCRKLWEYRKPSLELVKNDPIAKRAILIKILIGFFISFLSIDALTHISIRCCKMCKCRGKYIVIPSGRRQFFGEMYERVIWEKCSLVPFDGRQYRLINNADVYLKNLYGNYWETPSPDKREHHMLYELKL